MSLATDRQTIPYMTQWNWAGSYHGCVRVWEPHITSKEDIWLENRSKRDRQRKAITSGAFCKWMDSMLRVLWSNLSALDWSRTWTWFIVWGMKLQVVMYISLITDKSRVWCKLATIPMEDVTMQGAICRDRANKYCCRRSILHSIDDESNLFLSRG